LEARKTIERAKGILMKRLGLSEAEAFRRMQVQSQKESRKLVEIARAIVTAHGMM
jgi:response regulator NasT